MLKADQIIKTVLIIIINHSMNSKNCDILLKVYIRSKMFTKMKELHSFMQECAKY